MWYLWFGYEAYLSIFQDTFSASSNRLWEDVFAAAAAAKRKFTTLYNYNWIDGVKRTQKGKKLRNRIQLPNFSIFLTNFDHSTAGAIVRKASNLESFFVERRRKNNCKKCRYFGRNFDPAKSWIIFTLNGLHIFVWVWKSNVYSLNIETSSSKRGHHHRKKFVFLLLQLNISRFKIF